MKKIVDWISAHHISTSKLIVWFILINSEIQVWCSYYLAWKGKTEVVETLSKTIVVEILGAVVVYSVKALFENLSKSNSWPDKPVAINEDQDCD